MDDILHDHLTNLDIELDGPVRQQLNEGARWAKFISIIMFVACGLLLLFGVVGGAVLSTAFQKLGGAYGQLGEMGGGIMILLVVLVVAAMAVIYYFLFNFSRKIKMALLSESTSEFNAGLKSLKTFFIITTVLAIFSLLLNVYNLINTF